MLRENRRLYRRLFDWMWRSVILPSNSFRNYGKKWSHFYYQCVYVSICKVKVGWRPRIWNEAVALVLCGSLRFDYRWSRCWWLSAQTDRRWPTMTHFGKLGRSIDFSFEQGFQCCILAMYHQLFSKLSLKQLHSGYVICVHIYGHNNFPLQATLDLHIFCWWIQKHKLQFFGYKIGHIPPSPSSFPPR